MPHSSDSSDSSFSRSPPPGKQVEYFFPSLLPSDSPVGVARRGAGFLVLPRELRSKEVAGGMSTLLDLRHGIRNRAEHISRDPHPSAHSAKVPFPLRSPMAPIASASPGFPPQEAF